MGAWDGARYTVEDGLFGFVRFRNGTSMQIETAFALHMKEKDVRNVCLYGENMGASLFPFELYGVDGKMLTDTAFPFDEGRDWHEDCIRNFVKAARGEEELLVTPSQAVYVQSLVCALYRSAETGKPVMFE